jgi:hypothetical protein
MKEKENNLLNSDHFNFDLIKCVKELENHLIPDEYNQPQKLKINFGDEENLQKMLKKGKIYLI